MTILSPLPPSHNVELIAEALSFLEKYHFPLKSYSYHLQTTLFNGGDDFVVRLQHKSQEVFQDFWRTFYLKARHRKLQIILERDPVDKTQVSPFKKILAYRPFSKISRRGRAPPFFYSPYKGLQSGVLRAIV